MLLNHNVTTIKRHQTQPFPDLWPTDPYETVLQAIYRNQPVNRASMDSYHYGVKEDVGGLVLRVIVQPNGAVLYQSNDDKRTSEVSAFQKWLSAYRKDFRKLSEDGTSCTIVGKMAKIEDRDVFCAYYVIQGVDVYLDAPSISRILGLNKGRFDGAIVEMPVTKLIAIHVDKLLGEVACRDLTPESQLLSSAIVGLPIVNQEIRTSEDGMVAYPPRLITTPIHMKFMGFRTKISDRNAISTHLGRKYE